jgi:hypothetical protein
MKLTLTEAEKAELIPNIRKVLETGETWENETMHHPTEAIVAAILEIEGMERKPVDEPRYGIVGFDTNGWQWDWWQDFAYDGRGYTLAGSGYYGGHEFNRHDDE